MLYKNHALCSHTIYIMPEYSLSWILPYARAALAVSSDFNFVVFVDSMWNEMAKAGVPVQKTNAVVPLPGQNFEYNNEHPDLKRSAVEAWCYMQRRGFIVPRSTNFPSMALDHINFERTPRGYKWSRDVEPLPDDLTGYMNATRKLVPTLDAVIEQYLTEGLSSLENDNYFAAAVMVGAAAEKCLYTLAAAMPDSLRNIERKTRLLQSFNRRELSKLFDQMKLIISEASNLPGVPYETFNGADEHFVSLIKAVQMQRNDAVHPMNAKVSEESVYLTYLAFPHALRKSETLRDWFSKNPSTI
jgi:hypothetical protein